jgi:hypothetical protein
MDGQLETAGLMSDEALYRIKIGLHNMVLHQELAYLICRSASCMKPFRTGHK